MNCRARFNTVIGLITAVVVMQWFIFVPVVHATHMARVQHPISVNSASWQAVATPLNTAPSNQSLVLLWANSQGAAYQIFDVVNTGTIDLTGLTFHVTVVRTSGGSNKPLNVTFEACVGAAWTALNTCPGTIQTIGTTSSFLTTTVSQMITVGGRLSVQASTPPAGTAQHSTTIDISVDTTHLRAGTTTSS
jgi:hypothetical protein